MKAFFLVFFLVPGVQAAQAPERLTDRQIIVCGDTHRSFKVEVLDSHRQTAHLTYATGGAPVINTEGAYAQSGAGYDFVVFSAGTPVFTALLDPDLKTAHVPRNGPAFPCGSEIYP